MKKLLGRFLICLMIAAAFWGLELLSDRKVLNEELIRLHIVANSDSERDQSAKLHVRDAVLKSLSEGMQSISDIEQARAYIQTSIPTIQRVAHETLEKLGIETNVVVKLCKEAYETRFYDTFTLPAGVYESLQIVIGEGQGKNWWCVAFPAFCVPAVTEEFEDTAAGAGFSDTLSDTLTGKGNYQVRFFLLEKLGEWENRFFQE